MSLLLRALLIEADPGARGLMPLITGHPDEGHAARRLKRSSRGRSR